MTALLRTFVGGTSRSWQVEGMHGMRWKRANASAVVTLCILRTIAAWDAAA
jgi:hypothetical protein